MATERPTRATIEDEIRTAARTHGLEARTELLVRQCQRESSWRHDACNLCGGRCKLPADAAHFKRCCYGLFQLAGPTAGELGVVRRDWRQNVHGGVRYMAQLARRYGGDWARALAAYNWGMGRLAKCEARWGADWEAHAPKETRDYIAYIMRGAR
jgi:membrane-bound lytic murein transglycosylase MltF